MGSLRKQHSEPRSWCNQEQRPLRGVVEVFLPSQQQVSQLFQQLRTLVAVCTGGVCAQLHAMLPWEASTRPHEVGMLLLSLMGLLVEQTV